MRAFLRCLLTFLVLNLDAGAARADGTGLCIRPMTDQAPTDGPAAKAAGTIVSRRNQAVAPSFIDLPAGGKFPLIYDFFTEQLASGERRNRTFFWHIDPTGDLVGPYDLDDRNVRTKLSDNYGGASAADPDGRILFLVGSLEGTGQQIYIQNPGQRPVPLEPDLQIKTGEPHAIFWSDFQQAFLIKGMSPDPTTGGVVFRASILKGTDVQVLDGHRVDFASDLLSLGATALLGSNRLTFIDQHGAPTLLGRIRSSREGYSWIGIHETADMGWLYVDGDEWDHAVHVAKSDETWHIISLIRFVNDQDTYDRDYDQTRMQREELSQIILTGRCRTFSVALQRMIVCGDQMRELRNGSLAPIGNGKERLAQFLGDARHLGLALFRSEDGTLYGYDGNRLHPASGTLPERARVVDLLSSKRTFFSTNTSLFELRRDEQGLHLEELTVPTPHGDLFFTHFFGLSDDVVALLREGVYIVEGLELKPLWAPGEPEQIDTTSHLQPRYIPLFSGILFAGRPSVSGMPQFRLLSPCSGSN
jgi:hypothetical protein